MFSLGSPNDRYKNSFLGAGFKLALKEQQMAILDLGIATGEQREVYKESIYEKGNGSSRCAHLQGRGEGPGDCRADTGGTGTAMLPNLCSLPPCPALLSPGLRNGDLT